MSFKVHQKTKSVTLSLVDAMSLAFNGGFSIKEIEKSFTSD